MLENSKMAFDKSESTCWKDRFNDIFCGFIRKKLYPDEVKPS